jgi:hypothetical protein
MPSKNVTPRRKTIAVEDVKNMANNILANSVSSQHTFRMGVREITESILHSTGNYRGFRYLVETKVPPGNKPGTRPNDENRFLDTDYTRIHYF